jgi:hypothetical protein
MGGTVNLKLIPFRITFLGIMDCNDPEMIPIDFVVKRQGHLDNKIFVRSIN